MRQTVRQYSGLKACGGQVWDVKSGQVVETLESHTDWVFAMKLSKDESVLYSASADGAIKVQPTIRIRVRD